MPRTIFVWDIHGCFDEFVKLLDKINFDYDKDNLYLTWDLINKWPKAYKLIDFLVKHPKIKSVIWNNEINFLRWLYGIKDLLKNIDFDKNKHLIERWLFDKIYQKHNPLFDEYLAQFWKEHIEYLLNLPLWIESENWVLLHWGLVPDKKLHEHHIDEITRIRQYDGRPWYEYYQWEKTIIYGHWAADWLRIRKNTKWLDSGCVYGKRLTAYIWETGEIIQVSAEKIYVEVD